MRMLPSEEQRAMAQALRVALVKECSPEVLRASWQSGVSRKLWRSLADFGVFGLMVPEDYGGLSLDECDAVGVLEETGRAAVPGPIPETLAVGRILAAAGPHHAAEWLPRIASGDAIVSLGLGRAPLVNSADIAELLVMQDGSDLYAVLACAAQVQPQPCIDANRRLFTVTWEPSAAEVLVTGVAAQQAIIGARDRLLLGTSAQLVGLARQLLDMSVTHATTRHQFGQPLGSFQAVQHRLADVAVAIEFAGPVVARAAASLAASAPSAARDAAMAKVFASDAAERAAYAALQIHGAIGYTREHDLHLYALRAWSLALAHGNADEHRSRVADDLLSAGPAPRFPA
jgi:alkylation response protein AidB-like acyl-CoA dehydrogenase